jgi:urease subunit beta
MKPGEYILAEEPVICNAGRKTVKITVKNTGDRPIQVGSHTHFFEVNKALEFPREKAFGYRLNIPAGTAVRFEPGDTKEVELVEFAGRKVFFGCGGLTMGSVTSSVVKSMALEKARLLGYKGV